MKSNARPDRWLVHHDAAFDEASANALEPACYHDVMTSLTLRLTDEENSRVRLYAQEQGKSLNAAIRDLIDAALAARRNGPRFSFDSGDPTFAESDEKLLAKGFGQ